MALRAGDQLGRYELLGGLGAGGMGEVYRARDSRLGRTVAIKVLPASLSSDPARRQRLEHEARVTGLLNHPNILAVHDVGEHAGAPYLVAELLEGETLRERLRAGAVPVRKAVDYALQVARGLSAAHAMGIVHRDLKPENLFLTKDRVVKILDFGLARLGRAPEPGDEATAKVASGTDPGTVMGTAGYISPEQARGEAVDHRSDLFALGSVLYEMLSGRRAFHGESSAETLSAILRDEPPEFPADRQIPPVLDRLVRHCLEKKPDDRFQSARDLVYELEGLSGSSGAAGNAVRPDAVRPRRRWVIAGLSGVLAVVALAGAFLAGRRTAPSSIPTYRQITFRRGLATSGRFTPDGKTIVYAATWDDGSAPEIYSVRTDAPESRSLGLPPGQVAGVSSKGELAMLLPQTSLNAIVVPGSPAILARVPLSGGTPRPVAEDVICADWAPDGERLAALRRVNGVHQVEFPLGTVLARETSADQPLTCPRLSPRGERLAFGTPDGYHVLDTASGRSFSITGIPEWLHGTHWSWSPSGEEIWFTASDAMERRPLEAVSLSGRRRVLARIPGSLELHDVSRDGLVLLSHAFSRMRVFAHAPGGAGERELSVFDGTDVEDLSADGRLVLLSERGAATGDRQFVYLRQTDGTPPARLAEEGEATTLSPDGRWVLVKAAQLGGEVPKWQGLRAVPVGAGDVREIPTPGLEVRWAAWVPDGKRILVRGREPDRGWRLFLVDIDGGTRRAITPEGVSLFACGRRWVACLGPTNRLMLYPLEGGTPRELPGLEPGLRPLRLSEDETSLLVSPPRATRTAPVRVERVDLATGGRVLLHEFKPADMAGVWIYFAPLVTPDGRGYAYTYYQWLHNFYVADGFR